jgi:hypothetical protein
MDRGVQCTICRHVDDPLITSVSEVMITELTDGLRKRYGEITLKHGPMLNYLGITLDFTVSGEARLTMAGYTNEILTTSGVTGIARTPALDMLFDARRVSVRKSESGSTGLLHSYCTWPRGLAGNASQECRKWLHK